MKPDIRQKIKGCVLCENPTAFEHCGHCGQYYLLGSQHVCQRRPAPQTITTSGAYVNE